ncbi:MAG TPA: protein kinase [Vicinamibacterales bacterium]|nr:protein kinase [Vicinamibacterales bacterium]
MALPPYDRQRLKEVFAGARALPSERRLAYVAEACGSNEALRQEVESLLASDERAKSFLEMPAMVQVQDAFAGKNLEGQRIGPYRIASRIGAGGMGEVYQAGDTTLNRQVAIKVLLPAVASDPDRLARFRREAQVLASLNHPHIAQIHGFEDAGDIRALVMELVEGPTLADRIASGAIPINEALAIASQIADALEAAHEQGIVHRDLKPANIKVREDGTVKVLDFGLAKGLDVLSSARADVMSSRTLGAHATETGLILGTAAYTSPEQARGKAVDRRADLWSFGCVLYEMLTRQRAFPCDNPTDVLAAVVATEPDWTRLPPETPAAIRTLLRRCLEKNRARRLDSARAARLEIDDALATPTARTVVGAERVQSLASASAPSDPASSRPRQQQRAMLVGVAALAVLVAAGGFWRLWQQDYFWQNPLTGATVEHLTDFEGDEFDAAISPDGKFTVFLSDRGGPINAWLSQIGSGEPVTVNNGHSLAYNGTIRYTGFSGDGAQVWFQQLGGRLAKNQLWLAPVVGGAPRPFVERGMNPTWSPDGKSLAYHINDPGDPIFIADRNGSNPRRIFAAQPGVHCHYLTWSPDGRFIYFVSGIPQTEEMDIWRIPVVQTETAATPERITPHNARVEYPAWLDARTLIYSATAEDGSGQWLYAIDVERRIPHRVSSGIVEQYLSVAVSEAGPRRVVTTIAIPTASLWTVPISDSVQTDAAVTRVAMANTRALGPRFAPDYLAFLSSKGGANGLWKLEDGAVLELWRGDEGGVVAPPAISPDGRLISFSYRRQGTAGLYVMNADGTNVRTLADSFDVRGAASWSPDGQWVAVAANQRDGTRLFKVSLGGGQPVRLLDTLSFNPIWSPDGRFIVYSEQQGGGSFQVKAITPDKASVPLPELQVGYTIATPYRFMPNGKALIALDGNLGAQNFFWVDLESGQQRQMTDFKPGFVIQNFDVSPDGKQIVFDRLRDNSDIVLMNLAR